MRCRVQYKLTVMLIVMSAVVLVGVLMHLSAEERRMRSFFKERVADQQERVEQLLELVGRPLETFVYDYTYWDEMVQGIAKSDTAWAEENIAPGLGTYRADIAWAFRADRRLFYQVQAEGRDQLAGFVVPDSILVSLLGENRFCHFFAESPDGIIEIRGATVHPSNDPERKTVPQGYFLVGRLWGGEQLAELGKLSGGEVRLLKRGQAAAQSDTKSGLIVASHQLTDWRGQPLAAVEARRISYAALELQRASRFHFAQLAVIAVLSIGVAVVGTSLFVVRPLDRLVRTLRSGDTGLVKDMARSANEFGTLARLVIDALDPHTALAQEKQRAQTYLDIVGVMVVALDRDGRITLANRQACAILGWEVDRILGEDWFEHFIPQSARAQTRAVFQRLMAGQVEGSDWNENPVITGAGEERLIAWHNAVIRDSDGVIVGTLSAGEDITERRQAAEALQHSEERFRALFELAPDAYYVLDTQGRFVDGNRAAEAMVGVSRDELIGKSVIEAGLVPKNQLGKAAAALAANAMGRPSGPDEFVLNRRDGGQLVVETRSQPVTINGRRCFLGVARDITERKRAEQALAELTEELKRSNAELEQFAYVASHDLQEPLRMVGSYTQLLARRYKGKLDAEADEFIAFAVDGVTRMQRLINDLLTYSRVGSRGKTPVPTDAEEVFNRVLRNLTPAMEEAGATVTHDRLPTVMADEVQLGQLLQNLIGNAIKYHGDKPPQVHVRAERSNGAWMFSVKDNGIGIAPQYHERIFQIFQRLHTRKEYEGTGIGLAVCRKIVERHNGRIWVESKEGSGADFRFTLPATSEEG